MHKLGFALAWTILLTVSFAAASEPARHSVPSGPALLLVERGQPRAEIVVAGQRPRMVTLAALEPAVVTTFRAAWDNQAIVFEIVCHEPEMKKLNVSRDVHDGDNVVVSLATPLHSSYHLEVNPDGGLAEGNPGPHWKSLADVTTERGSDSWRVPLRIPVVGPAEAEADPHHRVAGLQPTAREPWY